MADSFDFREQFPDYPVDAFPALSATFAHTSWSQNMCPSITSDALGLHIWIDFPNPDDREHAGKRFIVEEQKNGIETGRTVVETDEWADVLVAIEKKALGARYTEMVGYDPFEDDPTISVEIVKQTLAELESDGQG